MKERSLLPEYYYYMDHIAEFTKKYSGKFLVIVDKQVFGAFDTLKEALDAALAKYKMGEFMVQEVGAREHLPHTHALYLRKANA